MQFKLLTPAQDVTVLGYSQRLYKLRRILKWRSYRRRRHKFCTACTVIADGVREISEEAGEVDGQVRELCQPMLGIGRAAFNVLAAIPETVDLILADRAFIADHPVPPGHRPHPLTAEMGQLLAALSRYLDRNMARLETLIEERAVAREAAGETDPIYRSWLFQPGGNWFNHDATFT